MTAKLPEFPGDSRDYDQYWEWHQAQSAFWEARCRLAVEALSKVQWMKDCGMDFVNPTTGVMENYAADERDHMYVYARDALKAIGKLPDMRG